MARFGYFQPDDNGKFVVKQEMEADCMVNPGGDIVQLVKRDREGSDHQIVAVFRLCGGEFVRQL